MVDSAHCRALGFRGVVIIPVFSVSHPPPLRQTWRMRGAGQSFGGAPPLLAISVCMGGNDRLAFGTSDDFALSRPGGSMGLSRLSVLSFPGSPQRTWCGEQQLRHFAILVEGLRT